MKLFNSNAGALLFEKAKTLQITPHSWRCLHIKFCENQADYSEGLRTYVVTNIIKDLLASEVGFIYLCEDGDVLILFQGQVTPILEKIGEHFRDFASHDENALYQLYDLSYEWKSFFALAEQKSLLSAATLATPPVAPRPEPKPLVVPPAEQFHAACARHANRKRLTVLLVEDDPFTRRLAANVLKEMYDVVEAGDANTALSIYADTAPDAVFLDIELPDASGHVVLSKLRALDPKAFVVMLSANSMKENILAALEIGAQGFVTKPFAREKLLHYLQQCETAKRQTA